MAFDPLFLFVGTRKEHMKMLKKATFVLVALALGGVPLVQAEMITFEFYPGPDGMLGTPDDIPISAPMFFTTQTEQLTDQFASVGILFTPDPPIQDMNEILDGATFFTPPAHTPPNLLASNESLTIAGRFTIPIYEVEALIGISDGSDRLEIFDAAGASLGSILGDDQTVTLTSSVPIDHFVISPVDNTTPAIDNLGFIPEPTTISLLALGAVTLIRRR